MKNLFLLLTLSLLSSAALAADPIWFSCDYKNENGTQVSFGTSTNHNGKDTVVVHDQNGKLVHAAAPLTVKNTQLDGSISSTVVTMPYGKIVLTQDTQNLIVTGLLTLRPYKGSNEKVKAVQSLIDGDAVLLDCAFE